MNSFGLHSARGNSGGHIHSYRCTKKFMRWSSAKNKADEYEYSVPGRVSCCREACCSTAGAWKVACRDVGRTQWEPQPADFPGGGNHVGVCGYGDSPSPSFLLFRVTWTGQRSSEWDGLVTSGENSQAGGMVVPGCLAGEQCIFCIRCICWLGRKKIVPYGVGGLPSFFVFLFILVWARHGFRATIWRTVLATA